MSTDLVLAKINSARNYLEKANSLQEVKEVIAIAEAAKVFAKRVNASIETINYAAEVRLRAERKLGEIWKKTPKAKAGRHKKIGSKSEPIKNTPPTPIKNTPPTPIKNTPPTLAEIGISKKTSSRAQILASATDTDFEAALMIEPDKELNHNRVVLEIKEKAQREVRREKQVEAAKDSPKLDNRIIIGDFREHAHKIADGSVSLIFTDPPYNRKASAMLLDLAGFAFDKLCDGGSMLCYVGQTQLPTAIESFGIHLRYWWTIACIHSGRSTVMREYGINAGWKAVLWFVKGTRHDNSIMVNDTMSGGEEKEYHEWQQAESEAAYWIDKLCPKDGLICDPFLGGGTTAAAAKKQNKQWIGFEIDANIAKAIGKRLKDE